MFSGQNSCKTISGGTRTMKKQELLKIMDGELMEKLFSFCYARTSDSQEARELCSDIVFELMKAANTEGDIGNLYGFLWKVARNTYADFSDKKAAIQTGHTTGIRKSCFRCWQARTAGMTAECCWMPSTGRLPFSQGLTGR